MRRTLGVAAILCLAFGGVAFAGHGRGHGGGGGDRDHRSGGGGGGGGPVVRDHRSGGGGGPVVVRNAPAARDHRGPQGPRGHVRVSNGRYVFPGGVVRVYRRPVIRERYYNVHVRPPVIVESYDRVDGYVWVGGSWAWGGGEWVWNPGYWAVAEQPMEQPAVSGGFSVSAGISIH